jgi:hypothetical protein
MNPIVPVTKYNAPWPEIKLTDEDVHYYTKLIGKYLEDSIDPHIIIQELIAQYDDFDKDLCEYVPTKFLRSACKYILWDSIKNHNIYNQYVKSVSNTDMDLRRAYTFWTEICDGLFTNDERCHLIMQLVCDICKHSWEKKSL